MTNKQIIIDDEALVVEITVEQFEEYKQLKTELEKYKQLANSFEADFYNALSDKESEYVRGLKAENEKLKQYKASKQASYETMQREWNDAKNEIKRLNKIIKNQREEMTNNTFKLGEMVLKNDNLKNRLDFVLITLEKVLEAEVYLYKTYIDKTFTGKFDWENDKVSIHLEKFIKDSIEHIKFIDETNKILYQEKCELIETNNQYKQALQDIKEVIKQEGYINKKTQMFKGSVLYQAMEDLKLPDRKILKIINEVLNV